MSNLKRMKIMKKLFYSVLALAGILAVSCNKEIEKPVAITDLESVSTHTVTVRADFGAETRTAYANDKTFSWVEGDTIHVYTVNEATNMARVAKLVAQSSGASVDFVGEVEDGFELTSFAVYTAKNSWLSWDENDFYVYLPGTTAINDADYQFNVDSDNPMSNVPLVGDVDDQGVFHFSTATGVLKFNLTDLPSDAAYFELLADDGNMLQGYFSVDVENGTINREGGREGTYTYTDKDGQEQTARYSYTNLFYVFTPNAEGEATIYVPVPVGTLGAGATVRIYNNNDEEIFSKKTTKDITITRNKITELTALSTKIEWISLGTGKYGDHYGFNPDYDQDVEILQNSANPNEFRIMNPYAGYIQLLKDNDAYEESDALVGPSEYITFRILEKGERVNGVTVTHDDLVWFDAYYTGILNSSYGVDPFYAHPSRWAASFDESYWLRSIVVKYQADGKTPANIQLAPVLFWLTDPDAGSGYYSGDSYLGSNNLIEIKFPGAERVDLSAELAYIEIVDSDPAQAVALVDYSASTAVVSAKLVIAANQADAVAALADASRYTEATEAGEYEVKMPANAPSGDYYVYAQTTVSSDLTPASAQLLASNPFKYFNATDDKGYTLDDILGTYSVNQYHYNGQYGDWIQGSMSFVVEESDDPLTGDIMFTEFFPEILGYFSELNYTSPLYASFNTATGEILIPGGQTIATAGGADWTVGEFASKTADVHMVLDKAGYILVDGNVCFYATVGGEDYGRFMWTNKNIALTRNASSSAPALAPAVRTRGGHSVNRVPSYKATAGASAPAVLAPAK